MKFGFELEMRMLPRIFFLHNMLSFGPVLVSHVLAKFTNVVLFVVKAFAHLDIIRLLARNLNYQVAVSSYAARNILNVIIRNV